MNRSLAQLSKRALQTVAIVAVAVMILGNVVSVSAAALSSASVELSDPRTSTASNYTVSASGFTTGTSIYCLRVALNDAADGGGSIPNNITTTSSALSSSTLITAGSWTVGNGTNGTLQITNAAGETPAANGNVVWSTVTNGDTDGTTYYGLLTTYSDVGCATPVDSVVMAFVYKDGALVSLTIEPTLTFTVGAVAASTVFNGATTSILSSPTGIDHGTAVTTSANGISAHALGVTTNAASGYFVYLRHTGNLTNEALDTIPVWTGTHATPTTFPAVGTEAWGYTTTDTDYSQFQSNNWAGFSTSNEEVMAGGGATSGTENETVGHQVGIATDTPAGTYTTTMIYTVVATY